MTPEIISVSQFVSIINETLNYAFPKVLIEGEVASFKVWQNRYIYFDVKDAKATLNCFMPVYALKLPVEDGMTVRVEGVPKLTDKGRFSLTVREIMPTGEGSIRRAYELLKQKLTAEGLFEPERKRQLPVYPQRVGLVTAAGSAAYADFLKIVHQRWPALDIDFAAVQVQGKVAPDQIVRAIEGFNQAAHPVEVVILIRGGGSLEDLQAFNTEVVVRAVASSRIPTLVGVGHEVDTSLADLAADLRAATPTDAAQRLVRDRREVQQSLVEQRTTLERAVTTLLSGYEQRLERTTGVFDRLIMATSQRLEHLAGLLQAMSPRAVLARGYSITRHNGQVLRDLSGLKPGAELVIELNQGTIDSTVQGLHHGDR